MTAALADVMAEIDALSPGPHSRGLGAQADTYRRVVARWDAHPPSAGQRRALFALIGALREELRAMTLQHTIPTRPPPGAAKD